MKIGNWKFTKLVFWFVMEKISGWPTARLMSIHEFFLKQTVKAALSIESAKSEAEKDLHANYIKEWETVAERE